MRVQARSMYASVARAAHSNTSSQLPSQSKTQEANHTKPESNREDPSEYYRPHTAEDDDSRYVLTLVTNKRLHERLTELRQKYFPPKLNKIPGHLTLFHALPGSRLEKDIVPVVQEVADSTGAFDLHAGRPFKMSHGIGIFVPKHQGGDKAVEVHAALSRPWKQAGFLSDQDQRTARIHWTIMNKVDDEEQIEAAFKELEATWEQPWGAATGLQLWNRATVRPYRHALHSVATDRFVLSQRPGSLTQPTIATTLARSNHYERLSWNSPGELAYFLLATPAPAWSNGSRRSPDMISVSTPEQSSGRKTLIHRASNKLLRTLSSQSAPKEDGAQSPVHDTRTNSPLPRTASGTDMTEYKPDLSQEVAVLSAKLINAINAQTTLDDQLQQTKHELELSKKQFEKLQAEKQYLDDLIRDGVLVKRKDIDPVVAGLRTELNAERVAREAAEKVKKETEAELENLTTALFEEANEMVAAARKENEAAEKRNSQLRSKLSDTEVLLASQQEQLQDLKHTMERMSERGDNDTTRNSIPSTPIHPPSGLFDGLQINPGQVGLADLPPEHPLFFSSLLFPVLRSDVTAYNEFQDLLLAARKAANHGRTSSNGIAGTQPGHPLGQLNDFTGSSPNLPGAFSFSNSSSPLSSQAYVAPVAALKDTKFYKRTLVEDIEPALRLDLAPGLSFLSRRSVTSSLLQGNLVVEPFPAGGKFVGPIYICALCGENRKTEQHGRKHRFRVSDEESAQRYPLCDYCLGRIRACGDFYTFLRMVREGHWRADSEEEQKSAWEESVRLRERMFWARIGGGVVPTTSLQKSSPSTTALKSPLSINGENEIRANDLPSPQREVPDIVSPTSPTLANKRVSLEQKLVDVFHRHRKSLSIGSTLPDFTANGLTLQRTASNSLGEKGSKIEIHPISESHEGQAVADVKENSTMTGTTVPTLDVAEPVTTSQFVEEPASLVTQSTHPVGDDKVSATEVSDDQRQPSSDVPPAKGLVINDVPSRPASLDSRRESSSTVRSEAPERKQSSVLARVRAMEAQAEK